MDYGLHNSILIIDLKQAGDNLRSLQSVFGENTAVIPVIKGDCFGLGLVEMANTILEAIDVKCMAVAHVAEGVELRQAGVQCPILILGGVLPQMASAAVEYDLTAGVGRLGIIPLLAEEGRRQNKKVSVQLALDTGLGRLGVRPGEEFSALLDEVKDNLDVINVGGTYSHFGDAATENGEKSYIQYERYIKALEQMQNTGLEPGMRHMSNSAASEWLGKADFDAVRLGRRLFFDNPEKPNGTVKEVATWRTRITNIKHFKAGETFAYGSGVTLDYDADIALIGVGYGDGLRHELAVNRAPMLLHGERVHLLSLCMDQSFVDVTGVKCEVGDEVTLFGYDSDGNFLSAQEVASYANDEGCGLTAMITPRVKRIYVK